ncbi:DUF6325 family protein [Streptacidiphilus carbonis]|uniref:DUF6325 family protein n=1 Tax=Streptacidiphilus carbonis TaxID=105422 RepID=UPI0005A6CF31|nr:DUF6325 family protein [Streptacidiphilus carbonis]
MPDGLRADTVGPVDVAAVAFPGNRFNGDVAPALRELQDSGTVRILDLTFVSKGADGSTAVVELEDAGLADAFDRVAVREFDLLSAEDLNSVAESLPAESSALVVVWENTWAARLTAALRGSGGQVALLERIPRDTVVAAIESLEEE